MTFQEETEMMNSMRNGSSSHCPLHLSPHLTDVHDDHRNDDHQEENTKRKTNRDAHSPNSGMTADVTPNLTRPSSVIWKDEIVTDVFYRPTTSSSEKSRLYYNRADMQRFKIHYKMQVKAAKEYQKRLREEEEEETRLSSGRPQPQQHDHHMYTNPISGLINRMTSYIARSSLSLPSPSSHTNTHSMSTETFVLVDTLYMF